MKTLFIKYKEVIRFVLFFIGTYLLLSFLYSIYLQTSKNSEYYPDFITNLVAKQSSFVINSFGYEAQVLAKETEPIMDLYVNNTYVARIIEGCNSISIVILFVSFIISFSQKFKKTALFLIAGITLIYAVNIIRIAILAIALYKYPQYEGGLHGVVFPGIIYGMVFLLWMIWVKMLNVPPKIKNA